MYLFSYTGKSTERLKCIPKTIFQKYNIYDTSVYIEFKIGGVKGKMRGVLMMTIKLKNILSWGLRWLKEMLFFKQGLAAVCTTEDYTGHEKALTKKDTFEGGNFSKTILIWFW